MTADDLVKAFVLVLVGLFVLADGVLAFVKPSAMWSVQLQAGDVRVGLVTVAAFVGFGLHLLDQMRRWWL